MNDGARRSTDGRRAEQAPTTRSSGGQNATTFSGVSERRVRLLYKTTCWTCDEAIPAGTTVWWDDDRRHATCTHCVGDAGPAGVPDTTVVGAGAPAGLDARTHRRLQVMRARRDRPTRSTRPPVERATTHPASAPPLARS